MQCFASAEMLSAESVGAADIRDTGDNLSEGLLCVGASCSTESAQCLYTGSCIMLFLPSDADLPLLSIKDFMLLSLPDLL